MKQLKQLVLIIHYDKGVAQMELSQSRIECQCFGKFYDGIFAHNRLYILCKELRELLWELKQIPFLPPNVKPASFYYFPGTWRRKRHCCL